MKYTVIIYTSPTCHYCTKVKDFLRENNITFTERDVLSDDDAREEAMQKSGQVGVPVTTIDNDVIVGFDKRALSKKLDIV